jgi:hypothetical protein
MLLGDRSGYMHRRTTAYSDKIVTTGLMSITIAKMGVVVEVRVTYTSVETPDGRPISRRVEERMGPTVTATETEFHAKKAVFTRTDATGKETKKIFNYDTPPTLDYGEHLALRLSELEPGNEVRLATYAPKIAKQTGVTEVIYKVDAEEDLRVLGAPVACYRTTATHSDFPMMSATVWFDREMHPVKHTMPQMLNAEFIMTSRELATAPIKADPHGRKGFLENTLIRIGSPIQNHESRALLQLRLEGAAAAPDSVVNTDHQVVQVGPENEVLVKIHRDPAVRTSADRTSLETLTLPTDLVQSDDPRIKSLAGKITKGVSDDREKVAAIRRYVHAHMNEDRRSPGAFGVGMDSASQVIETMAGDCTEYATLSAALCRAAGIPARLVMGAVYVPEYIGIDNVFVYHAWTEAHYDGCWRAADATLRNRAFDVGHVAIWVTDGGQDDQEMLLRLAGTIGQLRFSVVGDAVPEPAAAGHEK